MNPIGLVEINATADALQEERHEGGVVFFRDLGVHPLEFAREILAHGGRDLHPGEDELDVRVPGANAVDDFLKVVAGDGGISSHVACLMCFAMWWAWSLA